MHVGTYECMYVRLSWPALLIYLAFQASFFHHSGLGNYPKHSRGGLVAWALVGPGLVPSVWSRSELGSGGHTIDLES